MSSCSNANLDATCLGRTIGNVVVNDARILAGVSAAQLAHRLSGACLRRSRRHGKYLLVGLEPADWLIMHFGINGSLQHFARDEQDPPCDRVRFDFVDGHHLAYVNPRLLGQVGLTTDPDAFITDEGLGPDALDERFDFAAFEKLVSGRRRDVKSLLMDQAAIAGIGNIYSDEILFHAGLHPQTRCDRLDGKARQRLFRSMKDLLRTALNAGAGAERLADKLPGSFLIPHRSKGGRCPHCGGELASVKFSGRTAYYCPRRQPQPG